MFARRLRFWLGCPAATPAPRSPLYIGNQSLLGVFFRLGDDLPRRPPWSGWPSRRSSRCSAPWWRPTGGPAGHKVFAVAMVGLCTCLASPLSWTHHYVWILPLGAAVLLRRGLPRWVRALGGFWVVWVCACLPLAVLPYGSAGSCDYTACSSWSPTSGRSLGVALIVGLAWQLVVTHPSAAPGLARPRSDQLD